MPDSIRDGSGQGYLAKVDSDNRLHVFSKATEIQHVVSKEEQEAYQAIGTCTLASGTVVALHLKNTSTDRNMVVTYIRHQILGNSGGTSFPNDSNYYRIALGRTYASDGSEVTPVNVFQGSGNTAKVVAYDTNPTLTGTAIEIDRHYTKAAGDMNTFNKEGALIIPPNGVMELSYVGDQTAGTLYTRISFIMDKK